jgi:hypothetical protein
MAGRYHSVPPASVLVSGKARRELSLTLIAAFRLKAEATSLDLWIAAFA